LFASREPIVPGRAVRSGRLSPRARRSGASLSACPLGWRCGRWTGARRLRPGNVLDPEAPSWRWPAWPQSFRGSRRRSVGPAQGSGRRLTIGFAGRRTILRPAYSGLWALPTPGGHTPSDLLHGRSYHVGDLTRHRRRVLGPASSLFRSRCSPHSPTPRSSRLHRPPPERRFPPACAPTHHGGPAQPVPSARLSSPRRGRSPAACADGTPALYSRTVAKNILILWYTASGTFIWSQAAGCTMAPPERRLATPWGPKLS
jgi:hypothetical protein